MKGVIWEGTKAGWPICLGYFPAGVAFGVAAHEAGLSPAEIGLMSLLVFAGSSQFVAVSMLASGAGMASIVLTAFTINLRHLLMSSSLAVHLRNLRKPWLTLFAYGVTDESFALNAGRFRLRTWDWRRALVVNHVSNLAWLGSTVVGGYVGKLIPSDAFGIDYALMAMLIYLLAAQMKGFYFFLVAAVSGVAAVIVSRLIPGNGYIMIASMMAATLGLVLHRLRSSAQMRKNEFHD